MGSNRIALLFFFLFPLTQILSAQSDNPGKKPRGLDDFLAEFTDLSSLPKYESKSYSAEISTYDRTGLNNDGFSGTYSFIRRNPDSSLVIFDVKGSGLINRIWTPTPTNDSLDFYIDDTLSPAFTICYRDLFSGKVYPFVAPLCANQLGGYYCYLPIPFNVSCKIVFRGKLTRFHQIGYRLYPESGAIRKFAVPLNKNERDALSKVKAIWSKSTLSATDLNNGNATISSIVKNLSIHPGQRITLFDSRKPGRIVGFELSSAVDPEKIMKDIDLRITWDDETVPAVYCPLADYFGYAFGKPSMRGLLAGSDGEKNYSYFPMPFDKSARIELLYREQDNNRNADFRFRVFYSSIGRDKEREGKFYTNWHRDNPVPFNKPHIMLDITGKGHFIGTVLQSQGLQTGMTTFFEGDDSTVADGELRMHGTGSEDFFNGGWYALLDCWDAAMSLPLSGALEYSIPLCRTGGYRFFVTDKISFERSFFHSIEHGPEHNEVPADYTSLSYYYCSKPNRQIQDPSTQNTKPHIPDTLTLYPQLLYAGVDGDAAIETKWAFPTNGLTFYYTITDNTILRMSLRDIPAGAYHAYLDFVKSPDAAMFSIWQRQTQLTDWLDGVNPNVDRVEMQEASDITITPLNNSISFRFKTTNKQNKFILNRIILIRK